MFCETGDGYTPLDFNTWRETDGEWAMGDVAGFDPVRIEGTDLTMKGIIPPQGFWECKDKEEQEVFIKRNMRGLLQFFGITVYAFPNKVEIRGTIPTQVLEINAPKKTTAPIIGSPSPTYNGRRSRTSH